LAKWVPTYSLVVSDHTQLVNVLINRLMVKVIKQH
jgi:hypothetical protein